MSSDASLGALINRHHCLQGLFFNTLMTVAACSSVVMAYTVLLVLHLQPWWEAQYVIPMLGMLLGNTISGISVGLSTVLEELTTGEVGGNDATTMPCAALMQILVPGNDSLCEWLCRHMPRFMRS